VLEVRHPKDIAQLRHFDTYYANSWYVYLRYSEHRLPMLLEFSYRTTLLVWLTLSTGAVCKWWLCGLFLRSKTAKTRLTNCPARKACEPAAICYKCTKLIY